MIGTQINFYFREEDFQEVEVYLKEKGLLVNPNYSLNMEKEISILDKESTMKLLTLPSLQNHIIKKYIDTQNYYTCDIIESPAIELYMPKEKDNVMKRGRFYYTKKNQSGLKSSEFLKTADELFKWIKKHFKNTKLAGLEDFLISERTKAWLESSPEHKLADFLEFRKQQKIKVA